MPTYECEPTLNDTQVIDVCKKGFLMLEGVVPAEINQRALEYLEEHPTMEPTDIMKEDWFHQNVIVNPQVAGAVRSLLGANFGLPRLMSNHRVQTPVGAQNWHRDGGSQQGPQLNYLQVFYYPQECRLENGPTELLPGSHHIYSTARYMAQYGQIRGTYYAAAPAGSVFLTVYSVWHRRSASTASGLRNLLKYNYWRTSPPQRSWLEEPGFDPKTADFCLDRPHMREQFRDCYDAAKMYYWLLGRSQDFHFMGGQGWPTPGNYVGGPYGYPGEATNFRD
ncbi:MAG: phytanoyl-CoA dioxygenase family protein [Anaerolineales bacterium]